MVGRRHPRPAALGEGANDLLGGALPGPRSERWVQGLGGDRLVDEHPPLGEAARPLGRHGRGRGEAEVVEAAADLAAQSGDARPWLRPRLGPRQHGVGDRVGGEVEPAGRVQAQRPGLGWVHLLQPGEREELVAHPVARGQVGGDVDVRVAGRAQCHHPEPAAPGRGDRAEEQPRVLPAGQLEAGVGVVLQVRREVGPQHIGGDADGVVEVQAGRHGRPGDRGQVERAVLQRRDASGSDLADASEQRALAQLPAQRALHGHRVEVQPRPELDRAGVAGGRHDRGTGALRVEDVPEAEVVGRHPDAPGRGGDGRPERREDLGELRLVVEQQPPDVGRGQVALVTARSGGQEQGLAVVVPVRQPPDVHRGPRTGVGPGREAAVGDQAGVHGRQPRPGAGATRLVESVPQETSVRRIRPHRTRTRSAATSAR